MRQTAVAVDEEFRELNRELDAMSFPADTDSFTPRREWLDQMPPMSLKRVLQAVFKGTGWRYISGRDGVHRMNKTLPGGHRMELELDRGPSSSGSAGASLSGAFLSCTRSIFPPIPRGTRSRWSTTSAASGSGRIMWSGMRRPACWRFTDPRRTGLFIPIERT